MTGQATAGSLSRDRFRYLSLSFAHPTDDVLGTFARMSLVLSAYGERPTTTLSMLRRLAGEPSRVGVLGRGGAASRGTSGAPSLVRFFNLSAPLSISFTLRLKIAMLRCNLLIG